MILLTCTAALFGAIALLMVYPLRPAARENIRSHLVHFGAHRVFTIKELQSAKPAEGGHTPLNALQLARPRLWLYLQKQRLRGIAQRSSRGIYLISGDGLKIIKQDQRSYAGYC